MKHTLCFFSIFFISLFGVQVLLAQESGFLRLEKTKESSLISASFPKAGGVVITSEIGDLEFIIDPEFLDKRERKEGKGKKAKIVYTFYLEADTLHQIIIQPRNAYIEQFVLEVIPQTKIGRYYTAKLSQSADSTQNQVVLRKSQGEDDEPVQPKPITPTQTDADDTQLVVEEETVNGMDELKSGYSALIIYNSLPLSFQLSSNLEDGVLGTPDISADRKTYTYFLTPNTTQILTVTAKNKVAAKFDFQTIPNTYRRFVLGTKKSLAEYSVELAKKDDEIKQTQKRIQDSLDDINIKQRIATIEAEKRRISDSIATALRDSTQRAQMAVSPTKPDPKKKEDKPVTIEEKKGGSAWPWLIFMTVLGGGGYALYEFVLKEKEVVVLPDLPISPPARPSTAP